MVERFNIPSVTAPGKVWAGLVLLVVGGCTSVSQMQERYEAGDDTQLAKIATIAARSDYPYATRRSAARVLGEIGDPRIVPVLVSILGEFDQRTTLKEEALIALGRIGDPHAVTPYSSSAWSAAVTGVDAAGEVVTVTLTSSATTTPQPPIVVMIEATFCVSVDPPKGC